MEAGSGRTLFVNDAEPLTSSEARVRGLAEIISMDNGEPTASGVMRYFPWPGTRIMIRKTNAFRTVSVPWMIYADSRSLYLYVNCPNTPTPVWHGFMFGDYYSYGEANQRPVVYQNGLIIGRTSENSTSDVSGLDYQARSLEHPLGGLHGHRIYGRSGSISKNGDMGKSRSTSTMDGALAYPNPVDDKVYIAPVRLFDQFKGAMFGHMRGFYHMCHVTQSVADGTIITGEGPYYAGKSFQILNASGNGALYCMEISDTLDTN
jgi:hypothetical protein